MSNSTPQEPQFDPQLLDSIKIVLCQTSHPGNIGAAARAMKTMGLKHLVLVKPKDFPSEEAMVRSSGALDVLENAQVVETVEEALADCRLIIGTSSRNRALPWPLIEPREMGELIKEQKEARPVAIMFGRESTGLLNEELQLCHYHVNIPANPEYMSLNLASAVQLVAYEIRLASKITAESVGEDSHSIDGDSDYSSTHGAEADLEHDKDSEQLASFEEVDGLYNHLESAMNKTDFYNPEQPKLLPARIRRILAKARLNKGEVNILRGFLSSIDKYIKRHVK